MLKKISVLLLSLKILTAGTQAAEQDSNSDRTTALKKTITLCLLNGIHSNFDFCRNQVSRAEEYCLNQVDLRKDSCWSSSKTDREAVQCVATNQLDQALKTCENKGEEELITCSKNFSKEVLDCWKQNSTRHNPSQTVSGTTELKTIIQCLNNLTPEDCHKQEDTSSIHCVESFVQKIRENCLSLI